MKTRPPQIDEDFLELTFKVAAEYAGWRADRFVAHKIPRLSRTRVQKIIKKYAFDGAGKPIKPNRILRANEEISVYKKPPQEPDVPREFGVLFEDDFLLAVNKPPGLPVHPTARYLKNTLTWLLEERYGKDRPVLTHRIDSETSGIILCAKNIDVERKVKRLFADRKVKKTYLAVVEGIVNPPVGRIEAPLSFNPNSIIKVKMWCGDPNGRPALTEYETLKNIKNRTLLRLMPRTGRQHQLRAHLSYIGFPIVGDKMYGPDEGIFLAYIESGMTPEIEAQAGHRRHALHAASLQIDHPITGAPLLIECPLPDDISTLI